MVQKILLATTVGWPSAARLAGAFASLGAHVEAVFPRGHVLGVSRYLKGAHTYRPLRPISSFASAIAASAPDLVVPCDDRALGHLLALSARDAGFAALLTRSLGRIDGYPAMLSRSRSIAMAREEGVLAPLTVPASDERGLGQALESVGFPAVLKVDGSWGGDGVVIARTPDEAKLAFRKLAGQPSRMRSLVRAVLRKDAHFLHAAWAPRKAIVHLQRYVPGKPATSAFACRNGEVLAALHMDVVDWQGATGPASMMRRTDCPRMDEAARRIARRFALSGLHGLDFVRDEEGAPHLIEINPRATQICHLAFGLGRDLPAALLGQPPRPTATDQRLIALFPQELNRDPAGAHLGAAYHDIPWDDPAVLRAVLGGRHIAPPGKLASPGEMEASEPNPHEFVS